MICPHCKKPIVKNVTKEQKKRIIELGKQGFSCRDIESLMERAVSYSTVARILNKSKDPTG